MLFVAIVVETLFYVFNAVIYLYIIIIVYILCCYSAILFSDSITREGIDPIKILICTLLAGFLLRDLFTQDVIAPVGGGWRFDDGFFYLFEVLQLYTGLLILGYIFRIYIKAPPSLKRNASLVLSGVFLFTLVSSILTLIGRNTPYKGIHLLTESAGLLIVTLGWYRNPRLTYILPFKAIRLNVIDGKSGIPLFNYVWNKSEDIQDEMLYAGMLQGISLIVKESINRGEVQEIKLENGVLLVQREQVNKTIVVLLSTRSSKYLRECLSKFLFRFCIRFQTELTESTIVENFLPAREIVEDVFNFLPN
jgi:hypothetical protein